MMLETKGLDMQTRLITATSYVLVVAFFVLFVATALAEVIA